ncbi:SpoIIE family protein phosphatase [Geodermatophilus sp. SYSU D00742]
MASPLPSPSSGDPDVLRDPHRIAAARRLLVEVSGPAAFDRLSALAARLVGARHAKVTLFTDQDTIVGGYGLPPGVIGGPALLTGAISAITVRRGAPLVVPDAAALPAVAQLPAVTSGQVAAYLGVPLVAGSGHVVGVLAVYDPVPRAWSDDDAALLEQLAASVTAELELSSARTAIGTSLARLDIALEASSIGIWERDLRTGAVYWDERCAAIFGLEGAVEIDSVEDMMTERIHPDDRVAVTEAMREALTSTGEYLVEARVLHVDGTVRWTVSRGRVVSDPSGRAVRVLGTAVDVTAAREQSERRISAVQRAAAIAEVAAELANATRITQLAEIALRGAAVLGAESIGLAVFDPQDDKLYLHLTRRIVDAVASGADVELPPGGVETPLDDALPTQYVARHGERLLFADAAEAETRFPRMAEVNAVLGTRALAALPLRVEGRLIGSFIVAWTTEHAFTGSDVELLEGLTAQIALTASRLQADQVRAQAVAAMAEANSRLQLLADAGRVLSGSLDITQQVGQLADLVVPTLGDWCWLVVTDEQGRLHEMASAHRDRGLQAELELYVHSMVAVMTEQAAANVVTRTGRPLVLPEIDAERIERALPEAATRQLLDRLGVAAGVIVPLVARGQTLGALGLFNGAERGPHSQAEIDTAVEVGRRAGLSLHHARLYGQQRVLADALQHSMLTAPPEPDHCEIVVRYVPAAAGAEIGGDWYDAFLEAGGATVLAIGDVAGHDSRAAAAMGQLRGLLRGISYSSGATPAQVLGELDRAIRGLALDTVATALVARLEQGDADLRRDCTRLRWSSAGHPPPVVVSPDGGVQALEGQPADLLLGVDPSRSRSDRVAVLPAGTTVFLYTDGLVERRDRDLDAGTAALVGVLRESAGLPLEELCDRVLERLFLPDAEDDVALLAVRLHTQTRPRPAEAGPQIVPPGIAPAPDVHPEAGAGT